MEFEIENCHLLGFCKIPQLLDYSNPSVENFLVTPTALAQLCHSAGYKSIHDKSIYC